MYRKCNCEVLISYQKIMTDVRDFRTVDQGKDENGKYIKKMMKQHKKKKLAAERARLARLQGKPAGNHQDDYAARLSRHKRKVLKKLYLQ